MEETSVQFEKEPPETPTSDSMKLLDASERVKVRVAVSPTRKESSPSSSLIAIVGASVSLLVVSDA